MALTRKILKASGLLVLLVVIIYGLLRAAAWIHSPSPQRPGDYATVDGKQVRYVCKGEGAPLIFFESGFGSGSDESWKSLSEQISQTNRVCYYDRLGYGGSDDIDPDFSTDDKSMVQQAVLTHVAADQPVIIVGHSYGGILARRTLHRALNNAGDAAALNIAGLILVDSAHENQHEILRGKLDPIPAEVEQKAYWTAWFGVDDILAMFRPGAEEGEVDSSGYYVSFRWAHVLSTYVREKGNYTPLDEFGYDFGDLPMIVLSHDDKAYEGNPRFEGVGPLWTALQEELAALSDNSELRVVEGATHDIPADAPSAVIRAVEDMLIEVAPK